MKVRHIRKRAQDRIKRRNAFWWGFRDAVRRALESIRLPDWASIAAGLATFMDAQGLNAAALPAPKPRDPQPFMPKVQRWAGTA